MQFEDGPQLPLSTRRKALLAAGAAMFAAQVIGAIAVAPPTTGEGDANGALLIALWAASVAWSTVTVLLLIRQAEIPDIATASMLVVISAFAAFSLTAAFDARGTESEVNVTDALFLGVTGGALTAMIVWGAATGIARALRLPRGEAPGGGR